MKSFNTYEKSIKIYKLGNDELDNDKREFGSQDAPGMTVSIGNNANGNAREGINHPFQACACPWHGSPFCEVPGV